MAVWTRCLLILVGHDTMPGKSRKKKSGAAGNAFKLDFTRQNGREVFIPGSFWNLTGEEGNKVSKCTVFQYDADYKFADLASNSVS